MFLKVIFYLIVKNFLYKVPFSTQCINNKILFVFKVFNIEIKLT